mmetsp:Transcript_89920/g.160006  ORF Transcript_89920/g.160006 Transcript_89920/m.160006 type:complete len:303 (-) Transcript_89920:114-1022(-)|eukprot:CAMPEP_0197635546 /NCGR_PEP_ID=MMETSP1338-20131121/11334_1 /TAXON_ID=43686 ORGANISM="Pelagodinium beii, Strain RCC1491" /NCGR_SAMPLE_ID=MMETSP1338 /ASSEMBLY_ACC=CAM_ASM_000754 /LENGTH=302 /DNA_ID=CAMNT_0043207621 /DNA_START=54 /DNA_END=962 /DNA_ORIENTATION=-
MAGRSDAVKKVDDIDLGQIAVSAGQGAVNLAKKRPVSASLWVLGLLLAAFAKGFSVDEATRESYSVTLQHAQEVDSKELGSALRAMHKAHDRYYNAKGWFWSCDARCQQAYDQYNMARADVDRVEQKRQKIITEARREVGIWSTFGVKDVRNSFWAAWQSGKDFAARYTMMDAMFMMIGGKEETMVSMLIKIFFQYLINLTMGIIGAFFYFIYNVYSLVVSYGEPALSGIAFFLLCVVAATATVGTYLVAMYGTVAGGGLFLVKQAAKQAELEGQRGGRPRQVQYGGGRMGGQMGGQRSHFD